MRNIQIITLEKMENNECDIYSKTQGFRTQIAPLNLNRLTRKDCVLFCRFVFMQQPISLLNAWVPLEGGLT